ncbi:unnamed protein product, partial [Gadus morhua 'NCC']
MAEVIHARPNMMTKARNTQGEREERLAEIYATSESLGDQHQEYVGTEESSKALGTVRSQQPDPVSPPLCPIRAVVVLLVLLSVVLLAGLVGEEEMDFIYGKDLHGWLGATDEASEGMWRWVDGTVLSVDNPSWFSRNPDGGKEKNCLRRFWGKTNFKWTDESCKAFNMGL